MFTKEKLQLAAFAVVLALVAAKWARGYAAKNPDSFIAKNLA